MTKHFFPGFSLLLVALLCLVCEQMPVTPQTPAQQPFLESPGGTQPRAGFPLVAHDVPGHVSRE